ncbi:MAG TPA: pyridoxal 5'-phosphate synthase, partial [Draconibacterium sp.]|nr:pyridoxal 5'-phosphate synthase [Draconibacterium sp.]
MKLDSIRREYLSAELTQKDVAATPIKQFKTWLDNAKKSNVKDFSAMSLITCIPGEYPQSRIVLLKDIGTYGLTFYTNYNSHKGQAINLNNKVGLHFFWPELERQVRVDGIAEKTSRQASEAYFNSRPLESQIAAFVSHQSEELQSRYQLEESYRKLKD